MGILCKFIKQVGPNLKHVGLLLMEFQKLVPNKRVGWKICYLLEWKKCKNDNRVYSFIWHPRVKCLEGDDTMRGQNIASKTCIHQE